MRVFKGARAAVVLALAALAATPGDSFAQRARVKRAGVQTRFGSETPIARSVKLPEDVIPHLVEFDGARLKQCLKDEGQTLEDVPKHLAASAVDVNADGARDLLVQAESACFMGAHLTTWWVFSKVEGGFGARVRPGYHLVFSGRGDGLTVLKAATNGFRDIETVSFAGAGTQFYTTVWKFDGREYKARLCTVKSGGKVSRVKCDE